MVVSVLGRKEYKRRHGVDCARGAAVAYKKDGEYRIDFCGRPCLGTRLHEFAHVRLGHCDGDEKTTLREYTETEVVADLAALKATGRRVRGLHFQAVAADIIRFNCRPHDAFSLVRDALTKCGIKLSEDDKAELWSYCRGYYDYWKGKTATIDVSF